MNKNQIGYTKDKKKVVTHFSVKSLPIRQKWVQKYYTNLYAIVLFDTYQQRHYFDVCCSHVPMSGLNRRLLNMKISHFGHKVPKNERKNACILFFIRVEGKKGGNSIRNILWRCAHLNCPHMHDRHLKRWLNMQPDHQPVLLQCIQPKRVSEMKREQNLIANEMLFFNT